MTRPTRTLGISCHYHDAAACIVEDGVVIAAAQEERFTRKKHDESFPMKAIRYCLDEASGLELDAVAFYEKPILKLHRILETSMGTAPRGLVPFVHAVPSMMGKLFIESEVREALEKLRVPGEPPLLFPEHHASHAASAFYPSPFEKAAVLTLDGVGEWSTSTWGIGDGASLTLQAALEFPHSIGLLYSAFTYFCGFKVNSGEYKLMGLAPYGEPTFVSAIREHIVDIKDDGSIQLALDHFGYVDGLVMTNEKFASRFGGPARKPEDRITKREMDLARSIQEVTAEIVLRIAKHVRKETGLKQLTMAGGVSLNCVANGVLQRARIFDELWIQPAAGDAGGAIGAALSAYHQGLQKPRTVTPGLDGMNGGYLGPEWHADDIRAYLEREKLVFETHDDEGAWAARLASLLAEENVVGLFQGRMEVGPRALGHRSIVADARSPKMQSVMNLKIKQRESFRPFAPAVLASHAREYFDLDAPSPYMLLVAPVREDKRIKSDPGSPVSLTAEAPSRSDDLLHEVNRIRSVVPAITHVDHSARVQTVEANTSPRFHALLSAFEQKTGCPMLINTSFNVRGEPIVCTPEDAFMCFMSTEMDYLSLGPFLLARKAQPHWDDKARWMRRFEAD